MTLKRTVVLIALLAPVSCGNCADDKPKEVQPGTPKDPITARDPSTFGLKVTPLKGMPEAGLVEADAAK